MTINPNSFPRAWLVITAMALSGMASAQAQDKNAFMKSCRSDFKTFCASVQPGGGRIAECLKQHEAELSPACKTTLSQVGDCGPQIKKLCGAEASTPGAMRECVKSHASEFSAECRSLLSAH